METRLLVHVRAEVSSPPLFVPDAFTMATFNPRRSVTSSVETVAPAAEPVRLVDGDATPERLGPSLPKLGAMDAKAPNALKAAAQW